MASSASSNSLDPSPFQLLNNPLYLSLVCGSLTLILVAVCAALAVVTRHAASYYTHEDKRAGASHHAAAAAATDVEAAEVQSLCHSTNSEQIKLSKKKKKKNLIVSSVHHKNNNGQVKEAPTASPVRVHRGVHCNTSNGHGGVAVYPMTSFDSQPDQRPLC